MPKFVCPHCGGGILTEYNEMADEYMHWCEDCDREFNTPDMTDYMHDDWEDETQRLRDNQD